MRLCPRALEREVAQLSPGWQRDRDRMSAPVGHDLGVLSDLRPSFRHVPGGVDLLLVLEGAVERIAAEGGHATVEAGHDRRVVTPFDARGVDGHPGILQGIVDRSPAHGSGPPRPVAARDEELTVREEDAEHELHTHRQRCAGFEGRRPSGPWAVIDRVDVRDGFARAAPGAADDENSLVLRWVQQDRSSSLAAFDLPQTRRHHPRARTQVDHRRWAALAGRAPGSCVTARSAPISLMSA